jgi:ATPase family associated with various cellular activities (AAA)
VKRVVELPPLRFAELDARIRGGVEAVAHHRDDPNDPFRGLYLTDEQALALTAEQPPLDIDGRLGELSGLFGLDPLEQSILAVCAAPEISWRYGRLYGYLHDDLTRQLASPRLAAALIAGAEIAGEQVLARLTHSAPLRRLGALHVLDDPRLPLADQPLKCAEPVASVLTGSTTLHAAPHTIPHAIASESEIVSVPSLVPAPPDTIEQLRSAIATGDELALAILGPDAPATLAFALERPLLLASMTNADDPERMASLRLAAALARATLAFTGFERLSPERLEPIWRVLAEQPQRTLLCLESGDAGALGLEPALIVRVPPPAPRERLEAWSTLLPNADVREVAVKFRLSIAQIARAARIARAQAELNANGVPSSEDLDHGARAASRHGLDRLATRVRGEPGWEALVLPDRALEALHTISTFLRHRDRVLADWEDAPGARAPEGLTVLFAGESGTGKTMAAQVIAGELGLELFRIDLATVVSKYIGETEKNLDGIFTAAEGSNAILLFDEADALFGKRSEVHDAHDRYANVEVAYLLQRIESYAGAVILTTNLRQNIDAAFLRRLDLLVDFPFPEERERERLWRRLLPVRSASEEIDMGLLAARFKLAGGSIRNAAFLAALLAAEDDTPLSMKHLLRAIALEYNKLGRLTLQGDFEPSPESISAAVEEGASRTSSQA